MKHFPPHLLKLITFLKKLPGVGLRTAERFAFQMLRWDAKQIEEFSKVMEEIPKQIAHCNNCNCLIDADDPCFFCDPMQRDSSLLCIVSSSKDVFAIEETHSFKGLYHVIKGLLSPIEGRSFEQIELEKIENRIDTLGIKEVIIALDSTMEGEATSLYLKEELTKKNITTSRLATGLPMGSSIDFVDGGTLAKALADRQLL